MGNYLNTERGFFISSQLTVLDAYPSGDPHCDPDATGCIRAYLTQAPAINGTTIPQPPIPLITTNPNSTQEELSYVRFWNSPVDFVLKQKCEMRVFKELLGENPSQTRPMYSIS